MYFLVKADATVGLYLSLNVSLTGHFLIYFALYFANFIRMHYLARMCISNNSTRCHVFYTLCFI